MPCMHPGMYVKIRNLWKSTFKLLLIPFKILPPSWCIPQNSSSKYRHLVPPSQEAGPLKTKTQEKNIIFQEISAS